MLSKTLTRSTMQLIVKLTAFSTSLFTLGAISVAQTEGTLYSFKGGHDGTSPVGGLIADASGNLYGTTLSGGGSDHCGQNGHEPIGCGTVFELTPPANNVGHWKETILYAFQAGPDDGVGPDAPLAFDAVGNLYGTTINGGASGLGTVFELTPPAESGGAWAESVLHSFVANEGAPSGLLIDSQGNLYGECNGYPNAFGEIFELNPPAVQGGAWSYSILYTFSSILDGALPMGGLVMDQAGNLYGGADIGGNGAGPGCPGGNNCGLVFKLVKPTTTGGTWTEKVLHNFTGTNGDGAAPSSGVIFHNGNHLYGTTAYGGNEIGDGTVFELSPPVDGGAWTETTLYQFDRSTGGFRPDSGVVFDRTGNLYGNTTFSELGQGELFELSPPAQQGDPWALGDLYNFSCGNDGCEPDSRLIFGKGNNVLYGIALDGGVDGKGVVFGIVP